MSKWQRPESKAPGLIRKGVSVKCIDELVDDRGVRLERIYQQTEVPSRAERAAAKAARRAKNRAAWRVTHRPQAKGKVHDERPHSAAYLAALDNLRDAKRDVERTRADWNERVKEQRREVRELGGEEPLTVFFVTREEKARRLAVAELEDLIEQRREAMREVNAEWRRAKLRLRAERQADRQAEWANSDETRQWRDERFAGRVQWIDDDETPGVPDPGDG